MSCPRCGFAEATDPSCPRCGVVFAKLRDERPRAIRPASDPPTTPPPSHAPSWAIWAGVLGFALCALAVGWIQGRRPVAPAASGQAAAVAADVPAAPFGSEAPGPALPELASAPTIPPPPGPAPSGDGLPAEDHAAFKDLARKVNSRRITETDVATAAELQSRHPGQSSAQQLLTEVLLTLGHRQVQERRFAEAISTLRRASSLPWAEARERQALLNTLLAAAEWPGTEAYARQLVAADRRDAAAWYALGYALFRLDRNREASEALKACLALGPHSGAQSLLARLDRNAYDEQGMMAQNVSHFHVRYDGDEHVEVGREIVQALERHYATLVTTLDHRPQAAIPVILFSRERYHEAAGAPVWSGGQFDSLDGRIRMPIGGLTRNLTARIDSTLMHELTHAFVADITRGVAPRNVHEGFAQYMEGERVTTTEQQQLARGQLPLNSVHGFYTGALSFVEYLIANRGLGGMNDVLKAMGHTGDVGQAFRQVYGQDYVAMQEAWVRRLYQQHGG